MVASKAEEAATGIEKVFACLVLLTWHKRKKKYSQYRANMADSVNQRSELYLQRQKIAEDFAKQRKKLLDEALQALELEIEATGTAGRN